jgi:hypothetical protein
MKKLPIIVSCLFALNVPNLTAGEVASVPEKTCKDMTEEYYLNARLGQGKEYKSQFIEQLERDNICYESLDEQDALYVFRPGDPDGFKHVFILFTEGGRFHGWAFSDNKSFEDHRWWRKSEWWKKNYKTAE